MLLCGGGGGAVFVEENEGVVIVGRAMQLASRDVIHSSVNEGVIFHHISESEETGKGITLRKQKDHM